jgi:LAS superfamily LD-carboxypeptidase LdcB
MIPSQQPSLLEGGFFSIILAMLLGCSTNQDRGLPPIHASNEQSISSSLSTVNEEIDTSYYRALLTGTLEIGLDASFVLIPKSYTSKPIYLNKEAAESIIAMIEHAKLDDIQLQVISGYRGYKDQLTIWNRKWDSLLEKSDSAKCRHILTFSAMPKTSRHHWGTDVDLNSLDNAYFESGQGLKEYNWLKANAKKYGFHNVYSDKTITNRKGYEMERWHWSYTPLSNKYLRIYNSLINYNDIQGFAGAQSAISCRVIEDYVNGVCEPESTDLK